jgi:hypothetical protein
MADEQCMMPLSTMAARYRQPMENVMRVNKLIVAMVLALGSATVLAGHCPMDMQKIDKALTANPKLSAEQLAEVKKLRAEGEALHKSGKHQESVDTLGKALAILAI